MPCSGAQKEDHRRVGAQRRVLKARPWKMKPGGLRGDEWHVFAFFFLSMKAVRKAPLRVDGGRRNRYRNSKNNSRWKDVVW